MISALLIGRKGSVGFPGKNTYPILGKPMAFYPMNEAKRSSNIDKVFLSTDDEKLMELADEQGVSIITRPDHLCGSDALGEDVFVHGAKTIMETEGEQDLLVLLHCNSPTLTTRIIDEGIEALKKNPSYDSAVSVSCYNMWSPLRARRIDENGLLKPFVPFEVFGDPKTLNCDRDSQGNVYFADMALSIVRPRCITDIEKGLLPQKWMGQNIYPLIQEGGCDVDYEWQMPQVEQWVKNNLMQPANKN